jgi:hypothetical protein
MRMHTLIYHFKSLIDLWLLKYQISPTAFVMDEYNKWPLGSKWLIVAAVWITARNLSHPRRVLRTHAFSGSAEKVWKAPSLNHQSSSGGRRSVSGELTVAPYLHAHWNQECTQKRVLKISEPIHSLTHPTTAKRHSRLAAVSKKSDTRGQIQKKSGSISVSWSDIWTGAAGKRIFLLSRARIERTNTCNGSSQRGPLLKSAHHLADVWGNVCIIPFVAHHGVWLLHGKRWSSPVGNELACFS